jgi:hypothetical protein
MTTSNADKDTEQQAISFIADRIAKWYSHLEDNLVVSY